MNGVTVAILVVRVKNYVELEAGTIEDADWSFSRLVLGTRTLHGMGWRYQSFVRSRTMKQTACEQRDDRAQERA